VAVLAPASSVVGVFRFLKRMIILAGVGAIARKVMDTRSKGSGTGSAQWPPIKTSGTKTS